MHKNQVIKTRLVAAAPPLPAESPSPKMISKTFSCSKLIISPGTHDLHTIIFVTLSYKKKPQHIRTDMCRAAHPYTYILTYLHTLYIYPYIGISFSYAGVQFDSVHEQKDGP